MGPGVVRDHVTGRRDLAGHARWAATSKPTIEKVAVTWYLLQEPENLRGVHRAGAVVDGQRDDLAAVVDVVHRQVARALAAAGGRESGGAFLDRARSAVGCVASVRAALASRRAGCCE